MKKEGMISVVICVSFLFLVVSALSEKACDFDVEVLNQDPYPAVPGEELKIVFTVNNIDSTDCGDVDFEILEEFPFKVLESSDKAYLIKSGTFTKDYNTHKTIPVDFFVNEDAIDGDNPLEVRYRSSKLIGSGYFSKRFDINVRNVKADFEVFIADYDFSTEEIRFNVLNIGKSDVEAVTVEIIEQDGIKIKGSDVENIGDLSSNEDTTAEFKMGLESDIIKMRISYSDEIQVRRTMEKEVYFNRDLFLHTTEVKKINYWMWGFIGAVILMILIIFVKRRRKNKKE